MPECPICIERKRVIATCPRCETQGCRDCMCRRALENPLLPQCVGPCRGLSFGELKQTIGPGLISKAFRPAHRAALLEHEKQLIPSTMGAVDAVKRQEEAQLEVGRILVQLRELEDLMSDMRRQQRMLDTRLASTRQIASAASVHDVKTMVRCQKPDCLGCADHTGTCLVCGAPHCVDCGEGLHEPIRSKLSGVPLEDGDSAPAPHVCNPAEVASLKEVAKTAKPCPKCGAPTTRVSGCPQMWCTYCRTGYRYDTLRISKGAVSNPEREDFLRGKSWSVPRQLGDVSCGGFEDMNWRERGICEDVMPKLRTMMDKFAPEFQELEAKCRHMIDPHWWERPRRGGTGVRALAMDVTQASNKLRTRVIKSNRELTTMRVDFILKRLEEEPYAAALVRYDNRKRRDTELMPVFQTYEGLLQDLDREWLYFMKRQAVGVRTAIQNGKSASIEKFVAEVVNMYCKILWIQEIVQEGLDQGAVALGTKRLGRLGEDGRLRMN
jgi:hypothetical protein